MPVVSQDTQSCMQCLPGRLKNITVLLLHCLQPCRAWTWDRADTVAKGNNRFLFIAWSVLPLTLREPLHLQGVLPARQRQVLLVLEELKAPPDAGRFCA